MLTIKTVVHLSPIEGLGLFANETIRAGQVIWEYIPTFDTMYSQEEFDRLPAAAKPHIRKYSYFCPEKQRWVLCGDDARFMNHSAAPNTFEDPGNRTIAVRDIAIGEEITCDYRQFDARSFVEEDFVPAALEASQNGSR